MRDINKALSDIVEIRSRIAAGTAFRGYGPLAVVVTGVIGILTAAAQSLFLPAITDSQLRLELDRRGPSLRAGDPDRDAGPLAPPAFRLGRHHDRSGHRPVSARRRRRAASSPLLAPLSRPNSLWLMPGLWQIVCQPGHLRVSCARFPRR